MTKRRRAQTVNTGAWCRTHRHAGLRSGRPYHRPTATFLLRLSTGFWSDCHIVPGGLVKAYWKRGRYSWLLSCLRLRKCFFAFLLFRRMVIVSCIVFLFRAVVFFSGNCRTMKITNLASNTNFLNATIPESKMQNRSCWCYSAYETSGFVENNNNNIQCLRLHWCTLPSFQLLASWQGEQFPTPKFRVVKKLSKHFVLVQKIFLKCKTWGSNSQFWGNLGAKLKF